MRFLMAIALVSATSPLNANPMNRIDAAKAERVRIEQTQVACEQHLQEYIDYSIWNRRNLAKQSWDLPGGFVDPSAINKSRYFFQELSRQLVIKIDNIQRSSNPRVEDCRKATDTAMETHWRYTCEILVPNDTACSGRPSYPTNRQR